jgi:hypothetical protein
MSVRRAFRVPEARRSFAAHASHPFPLVDPFSDRWRRALDAPLRYHTRVVDVTIESNRAVFTVQGWDKLWSLRSRLELPLAHITGAEANVDQVNQWWHGLKVIGTDMPGLFAAGTFYYHGELVFWDVRHPTSTIIVSLDHERYRKLIIEVSDPGATVALLRDATNARKSE